jgi:pimeloyl-ACP methyl ester carboxylesterase
MTGHVTWIGGWASPIGLWEREIASLLPACEHRFLDAHELLDGQASLGQELSKLDSGSLVVAWSLGSLLALELMEAGNWPCGVRLVAVCPVLDFCDPSGPWRPLVLDRMSRALGKDLAGTLTSFRERMWPAMPEGLAARWLSHAMRIPLPWLVRGLEVLRDRKVNAARLDGADITWVTGGRDAVSPFSTALEGDIHRLDTGHVPFLEAPDVFRQILSKLA